MGNFLTIIGLTGTAVYLAAIHALIGGRYSTLTDIPLNAMGDFLAGVFGPLAIFWLILGFFQQGKELQQNTEALELQAKELKNSVEQQRELVAVTRSHVEAEITSLHEERQRIVSQAQPNYVFQGIGSISGGSFVTFKSLVKNTGATVTQIVISSDKELQHLSPTEIPAWETNSEISIAWQYPGNLVLDKCTLTISYLDRSNNPRAQKFNLISTGEGVGLRVQPLVDTSAC